MKIIGNENIRVEKESFDTEFENNKYFSKIDYSDSLKLPPWANEGYLFGKELLQTDSGYCLWEM